jgi:hypothetical protein
MTGCNAHLVFKACGRPAAQSLSNVTSPADHPEVTSLSRMLMRRGPRRASRSNRRIISAGCTSDESLRVGVADGEYRSRRRLYGIDLAEGKRPVNVH